MSDMDIGFDSMFEPYPSIEITHDDYMTLRYMYNYHPDTRSLIDKIAPWLKLRFEFKAVTNEDDF